MGFIEAVCNKCERKLKQGEEAQVITLAVVRTSGDTVYFSERRVLICMNHDNGDESSD